MLTALMVILLVALAVLTIGGAIKAHRLEKSAADGPQIADYRDRITDDDRQYIAESWKNAAGTFPHNPRVAIDVAHNAVASVLHTRGIESARIPAKPADTESASPEELRQELLRYERIVNDLTGTARVTGATGRGDSRDIRQTV